MSRESRRWVSTAFPHVVVYARGRVPALEVERFAGAVGRLLDRLDLGDGARLRITGTNTEDGPFLVQVNLRVGDTPARIQTPTRGPGDALPVVVRLEQLITAMRAPWRPRPWPDLKPLPETSGPGELARRKSVSLAASRPLGAAAVMDAMDYDVHLFTDAATGQDAVIYRAGPSGLRLARQCGVQSTRATPGEPGPFTVNPRPAPALTETGAVDRVRERRLPYLFYTDPSSGRGHLLYRRYGTGLTLLTPRGDDAASTG
ncbi:sigma 54 modulation/S30EA ribosomal C-terminal domain-containing protein [Nocardia vaccinii]|uniref:sigma 54 modulation/S30EA ribosomal C-terminal domain-containing protein n=1 Tax=Nocardia vaccinii TaxID=1822 RepID=UPI001FE15779|nr:sigma 54 modulation/S30EA ribosomal C-terminal domain-containing protein [Nocardia vaccinii]